MDPVTAMHGVSGDGRTVHVIAEAGVNHNGDLGEAKRLAAAAKQAAADSVKVQLTYPEAFMLPELETEAGFVANEGYARRGAATLDADAHRALAAYGREIGIVVSASAFDRAGIDLLLELGAPYIKIASGDVTHIPLLRYAAAGGVPVLLSTGMATLGEIEAAVDAMVAAGGRDIVLMHCVAVYPCPTRLMNLDFIDVLDAAFGLPLGLSDHSESDVPSIAAVAKGARWIEKHVTLDRAQPGFDHAFSLEPADLARLVETLRLTAEACRSRHPKVGDEEAAVRARARRGLYAARDLAAGEVLRKDDVLVVRPAADLAPADLETVVGRPLGRPRRRFSALRRADFG